MEKTGYKIISGAPLTLAVKGWVMMIMMMMRMKGLCRCGIGKQVVRVQFSIKHWVYLSLNFSRGIIHRAEHPLRYHRRMYKYAHRYRQVMQVECLRNINRLQNMCYCFCGFAFRNCGYNLSCVLKKKRRDL